jgi:predicted  nucleic acid-binding Zn-ribbon protein
MLETIEKLLILQDRDKQIRRVETELAHIDPQRQGMKTRAASAHDNLERSRLKVRELESRRKQLELDVEAQKELINKYANQQLQTRKNEEYRALAHEIDTCRATIRKVEDQELDIMEQSEAAQKQVAASTQDSQAAKTLVDDQISQLNSREEKLKQELASLTANRQELALAVDETARARYERLARSKGENVVVGVQHGVCGGCHMRLPTQILVSCQAQQELVACINCGRILYYTRDMVLAAAE